MLSVAVALLAAGVLCWPAGMGHHRLSELNRGEPAPGVPRRSWAIRRRGVLLVALGASVGALLAGPGGGLAAAMVAATATTRWRAGRDRRAEATAVTGLSDVLGVLVAELRAGAHPGEAIKAAADMSPDAGPGARPDINRALSSAAAAAGLGGDVPAVLRTGGPPPLRPWLDRLAEAWSLADRYGIPLAELLDAVRSDTEHRVRFAAEVQARLAGPRATAAVLAGLPLLGIALGQAVGAAPVRALRETGVGQMLLVIGTALACVGVLWSARLVSRAVPA